MDASKLKKENEVIARLSEGRGLVWINPKKKNFCATDYELGKADIDDASARLLRFAPLIKTLFPETEEAGGIIESPLTELNASDWLPLPYSQDPAGPKNALPSAQEAAGFSSPRIFLKRDSDLAVAGSVKARGGIYEVLLHSEELALKEGLISGYEDDYTKLASPEAHEVFSKYKMQVGSTGNLGVSIGMMSAALGYHATVHMSSDAKQWKKDYLRGHGVEVMEYAGDYSSAVEKGRAESDSDPMSYFVDDENSKSLFLGYAAAPYRLEGQLKEAGVSVDEHCPLFVYIPCGVGGAPGGIAFGLKMLYGDNVHVFFVEPTEAPCMLLGLASGLHNAISVQDIGLSGKTDADGLAVGRPSGFVGRFVEPFLSGEMTVEDSKLYEYLRKLRDTSGLFIEPSACAAFEGPASFGSPEVQGYLKANGIDENAQKNATHIVWATGGKLVPGAERDRFYGMGLE